VEVKDITPLVTTDNPTASTPLEQERIACRQNARLPPKRALTIFWRRIDMGDAFPLVFHKFNGTLLFRTTRLISWIF
jgi:hypothetical protein